MSLGIIGTQPNCFSQTRRGCGKCVLSQQDVTQVEMGLGILRVDRQGSAKMTARLVQISCCLQCGAEVVVSNRIVGFESDGFGEAGSGPCHVPLSLQYSTEIVVRPFITRLKFDGMLKA